MALTLPDPNQCCTPCESPVSVQVPGPAGAAGTNGTNGTNGTSAFTTFTAAFMMPAELASAVAMVGTTAWMGVNQIVYGAKTDGSVTGYFQVTAIGGATSVTLKNLEDAATSAYAANSAAGSVFSIGSTLQPAGLQGPGTGPTGAASGDLKGTYPSPKIALGNALGALIAGNGTDCASLTAGTNGQIPCYDSTQVLGVIGKSVIPITGGSQVADNRVPRLDGATGLPVPLQSSKVTINDQGAITADGSGGNARGTDAVDLQVTRTGAAQVASGTNSTIAGGEQNTASAIDSTVAGGFGNTASGAGAVVAGGTGNTASAADCSICGGNANSCTTSSNAHIGGGASNLATGQESVIAGGKSNQTSNTQAAICGGDTNTASAIESFVGGGNNNLANGTQAAIVGGASNTASGANSAVGGGGNNIATAIYSSVPGGNRGVASRYGQLAHANGRFAADGDAQTSELVWRNTTTDATQTEIYLDGSGATQRAVLPDNTSWAFNLMLVARRSNGDSASWKAEGLIRRGAGVGTTAMVCAVTSTVVCDGGALPWAVAGGFVINADTVNGSLRLLVTGTGGATIRWVAWGRIVEVGH